MHETVEEGHGRRERRRLWTTTDLSRVEEASKWPGLRSITMIERERQVSPDGEIASERHYFISSRARTSAKTMASLIRDHWSIENQYHWVLDVAFREDDSSFRWTQECRAVAQSRAQPPEAGPNLQAWYCRETQESWMGSRLPFARSLWNCLFRLDAPALPRTPPSSRLIPPR